jgi:streptomycin 6-kinase
MGGVSAFVLPENLVDSVRSDHSPRRDIWLAARPRLINEFTACWSLAVGPPFQPGGRSAWAAPARDRAGRDPARHEENRDWECRAGAVS